jgi:hypothetical protein
MDGRRARSIGSVLAGLPRLQRVEPRQRIALTEGRLRLAWATVLGLGWPLAFLAATVLEPAPAHAHEAVPTVVAAAQIAVMVGLYATVGLAIARHSLTALAAAGTSVVALALTAACPLSGHHQFGMWWFGQLALVGGMLAVSVAALGSRAREAA